MICPICKVEMKIGFAIEPSFQENSRGGIVAKDDIMNVNELKLIKCWKCPLCGHSDDGR